MYVEFQCLKKSDAKLDLLPKYCTPIQVCQNLKFETTCVKTMARLTQ